MKKILIPLLTLLLAATLVVSSVFAWFVIKTDAGLESWEIPIEGENISSVSIKYYNARSVGDGVYGLGAECASMPAFSTLAEARVVAEIGFSSSVSSGFALSVTLSCTSTEFVTVKNENGNAVLSNAFLSNISEFRFLSGDSAGSALEQRGETQYFVSANGSKRISFSVNNAPYIADGDRYKIFLMIGYNREAVSLLYFSMLQQGVMSNGENYEFPSDLLIKLSPGDAV